MDQSAPRDQKYDATFFATLHRACTRYRPPTRRAQAERPRPGPHGCQLSRQKRTGRREVVGKSQGIHVSIGPASRGEASPERFSGKFSEIPTASRPPARKVPGRTLGVAAARGRLHRQPERRGFDGPRDAATGASRKDEVHKKKKGPPSGRALLLVTMDSYSPQVRPSPPLLSGTGASLQMKSTPLSSQFSTHALFLHIVESGSPGTSAFSQSSPGSS